ncbi:MAG TPA: response regulator transcription factor [Jatrophihabitans sp.]|jgi:DNA-binding NarL/FixJ family response regulator
MGHVPDRGVRVLVIENDVVFADALMRYVEHRENAPIMTRMKADTSLLQTRLAPIQPDIVTLDPDDFGDPVDAVATIGQVSPHTSVLLVSMSRDRTVAVRLAQAGAVGWIGKDEPVTALLDAIAAVSRGEAWFPPQLLGIVIHSLIRHPQTLHRCTDGNRGLTEREREILAHILSGRTSREIAQGLHLSTNTIRSHRRRIGAKLRI